MLSSRGRLGIALGVAAVAAIAGSVAPPGRGIGFRYGNHGLPPASPEEQERLRAEAQAKRERRAARNLKHAKGIK